MPNPTQRESGESKTTAPAPAGPSAARKRISLICFSGDFDRLVATFTLASGAAAVGYEVNVFFTFWGLNILRKARGRQPIGKGFLARCFNFLQGGARHLPLSRLNFGGRSPRLMTYKRSQRGAPSASAPYNSP